MCNISRIHCLEVAVYNLQFDSSSLLIPCIKSVGNCLTFFRTSTFNLLVSKSYNSAKSLSRKTFYFRINGILPEICSLGVSFYVLHHSSFNNTLFLTGIKMCSRTQPIQAKYQVFIVKCQGCGDWKNGENVVLKWKGCLYFNKIKVRD